VRSHSSLSSLLIRRWPTAAIIILLVALADQGTKYLVVANWPIHTQRVVIPHFFHLVHFRNTGAAWGMFSNHSVALAVLSVIVFGFVWWKFHLFVERFPERGLALGLILGGIAGNLIDRIWRKEVVDFLFFFYKSFEWPAFNIADSAICCGVILFAISSLFRVHHHQPQQA
jgi:signal peptidase II